jgi:uncharacterized membrane protein
MNNDFPPNVEKIVDDYIARLSSRLRGIPEQDRGELLNEIRSHIYESYISNTAGEDIERILSTLRRLGDPADVVSTRMPEAVKRMGAGKKAPLYLVGGALIALFGLPLGAGALALLVALLVTLLGLLITFYSAGISLVIGGFLASIFSSITILAPGLISRINEALGTEVVRLGLFPNDPELSGYVALILSLILMGAGLLMLWSGKYVWRGWRFVVMLTVSKMRNIFARLTEPRTAPFKY